MFPSRKSSASRKDVTSAEPSARIGFVAIAIALVVLAFFGGVFYATPKPIDPSTDPYAQGNAPMGGGPAMLTPFTATAGLDADGYIMWIKLNDGEVINANGDDANPNKAHEERKLSFTNSHNYDVIGGSSIGNEVQLGETHKKVSVYASVLRKQLGKDTEETLELLKFYNEHIVGTAHEELSNPVPRESDSGWFYRSINDWAASKILSTFDANPDLTTLSVVDFKEESGKKVYTLSLNGEEMLREKFSEQFDESLFAVNLKVPRVVEVFTEVEVYTGEYPLTPPPAEEGAPTPDNPERSCIPMPGISCN